jgi:hypothetical protein
MRKGRACCRTEGVTAGQRERAHEKREARIHEQRGAEQHRTMLLCAVAAMSFVVPQARRARDRASSFVPRACQGQPEEPPFQVGQRVEGLYGAVCAH